MQSSTKNINTRNDLPGLMPFSLQGQTAVVTGGGRGIGKAICMSLAHAGANIVVAEIDPETGPQTAREIEQLGYRAMAVPLDVRKRGLIDGLLKQIVNTFGTIDVWVNNAGGAHPGQMVPPLEMDDATWDAIIDLNLKSAFICSQAAARMMIQQGNGAIINIASLAGLYHFTQGMHYGAAKAGVINLTRTLAAELGKHRIRVNAVIPGFIVTEYTRELTYDQRADAAALRSKFVALQRLGAPEDIGPVVAFLASAAAGYITGQVICVDGGFPHFPDMGSAKNE
ncbi:MAG: 3-oxoacyl-ACP reductase FabG [Desulfobacteraceae bacterium]|nr:MAG: 3-oxoacyl-ACP reductase FabG [Desulfobacteraceae bacterium]